MFGGMKNLFSFIDDADKCVTVLTVVVVTARYVLWAPSSTQAILLIQPSHQILNNLQLQFRMTLCFHLRFAHVC
jgi:hypothetical protein